MTDLHVLHRRWSQEPDYAVAYSELRDEFEHVRLAIEADARLWGSTERAGTTADGGASGRQAPRARTRTRA